MKRVGIITFLHNENYGSSLQAYALQRTVREMGYECAHLDYCPDSKEKLLNLLRSGNHPKLILEGMRKRSVRTGQEGARKKSRAIPAFYQKRMQLTERCRNLKQLRAAGAAFDILICGSDQIWNPVWLNPAYFLTFAGKETRKVAYAASLGIRMLPAESKIRRIRKWIRGFTAVSVREEEGASLLQQITGRRPDVMPDPVCLLSREEWMKIASPPPEKVPYLLCYFIGENTAYREKVREISIKKGLKVLEIPVTGEGYQSGFGQLEGIGPEEFLGAVAGAALFCTDSFHGLVFGTLLGVETEVFRRYADEDPESKNSRVDHFQRMIRQKGPETLREEGREWLRTALESE